MSSRIVVMGDVKSSSVLDQYQRQHLQHSLEKWLSHLEKSLGDSLETRMSITRGDDFQVLVLHPEVVADIFWAAWTAPENLRFRLGVGKGEVFTELRRDSRLMDGPAFHMSRDAVSSKSTHATFLGFGQDGDMILGGLAEILHAHLLGLTAKQREVVERIHSGATHREVAETQGISRQAVSKLAQRAQWDSFEQGEEALRSALHYFGSPERNS